MINVQGHVFPDLGKLQHRTRPLRKELVIKEEIDGLGDKGRTRAQKALTERQWSRNAE